MQKKNRISRDQAALNTIKDTFENNIWLYRQLKTYYCDNYYTNKSITAICEHISIINTHSSAPSHQYDYNVHSNELSSHMISSRRNNLPTDCHHQLCHTIIQRCICFALTYIPFEGSALSLSVFIYLTS